MGFGFRFCLTGEREARGRMYDCWSTLYSGATCAPFLHANNAKTPLTTLPRLDHSEGAVWRRRARIGVVKLLSLLTFFAAAKKVSPAPDRGRANKPKRIQVPQKPERIKRCKQNQPQPDPNPNPSASGPHSRLSGCLSSMLKIPMPISIDATNSHAPG
jgi:hypothetical protein